MSQIMLSNDFKVTANFPIQFTSKASYEDTHTRCRTIDFLYEKEACELAERKIIVDFSFPVLDICGKWFPTCGFDRALKADWFPGAESMTSISAPVICFYNQNGENKYTIALSEIKQKVVMKYGVHEEDGTMLCKTEIRLPKGLYPQEYHLKIWETVRVEPYWESISRVSRWWEEDHDLDILKVPDAARQPLYSFWYSKHQQVDAKNIEKESMLASQMGFPTIIVDDGWQTDDSNRGYAFCGDWEPSENKFSDFPSHVKKVQSMGIRYLMWFSVPFLGKNTRAWDKFHNKLLCYDEVQQAGVLDLRYPEVREYLKDIYVKAVKEWRIDGLKLDFIDEFYLRPESPAFSEGMDFADVQEALDVFLTEVIRELKAIRPDILIEFRQRYIGPQIRKYGNLLRVTDCPGSGISNRVGTIDLRLLSGETAVHSDMLMWHREEKPEDAALQIISCIFSTVQISVELENITEPIKEMLTFWMKFMRSHVDLLQKAKIQPQEPENLYPQVRVEEEHTRIQVHYSRGRILDLREAPENVYYIHGTKEEEICLRLPQEDAFTYKVMNCKGKMTGQGQWTREKWDNLLVPTGGMIEIKRVK